MPYSVRECTARLYNQPASVHEFVVYDTDTHETFARFRGDYHTARADAWACADAQSQPLFDCPCDPVATQYEVIDPVGRTLARVVAIIAIREAGFHL